jgi:hypothetical protein
MYFGACNAMMHMARTTPATGLRYSGDRAGYSTGSSAVPLWVSGANGVSPSNHSIK